MSTNKKIFLLILTFSLCACGSVKGEWKHSQVAERSILTTQNMSVSPFNTYMNMYYFFYQNEKYNVDSFENMSELFTSKTVELHKKFDRHYNYYDEDQTTLVCNVKTINESYGTGTPVSCSDELYELLKEGCELFSLTNGMFNIFTGGLSDFWEFILTEVYEFGNDSFLQFDPYNNEKQQENLNQLVSVVPQDVQMVQKLLTFNDETKEVTFHRIEELDPILDDYVEIVNKNQIVEKRIELRPIISVGGIAKGYATDLIKKTFLQRQYVNGYLSSGGSSITTFSKPIYTKEQKGHKISVVNPRSIYQFEKKVAFSMLFQDEFSFSTSGNYTIGKSYSFNDDANNEIYRHHIFDPSTGIPSNLYCSVSVASSTFSNAYLDALTTTLMNLSIKDGLKLKEKLLNQYPGYDLEIFYLAYDEDGLTLHATSTMNKSLMVYDGVKLVYEK